MNDPNNPGVLAVVPLPSSEERTRREISMNGVEIAVSMLNGPDLSEHRRGELALVLQMDAAMDVLLNTGEDGLDIRIETARDLVREFRTCIQRRSKSSPTDELRGSKRAVRHGSCDPSSELIGRETRNIEWDRCAVDSNF